MNIQVVQSEDSAVQNKSVRFHSVKTFVDSVTEEDTSVNCGLEVCNRYGATFILHNGKLRIIETKNLLVGETLPYPVKTGVSTFALSCDEALIAIAQGPTVSVFETKVFCQQPSGAPARSSFIVSKAGTATLQLAWNPTDPKLISALGQDGTIILIRILDNWAIEAVSVVDTTYRCMSWSPKGKQLAVGGTTSVVQLKLDLKEAKRIPLPPGQETISIYWLSTLQFLVSFQPSSHDDIKIMLLTLSKTASTVYKDFGDIFLSDDFTDARVISKVIPAWKLHLLFSSTSSDVIVISNDPSLPISDLIVQEIEDRYRAALPLDNFCRGAGIYFGCSDSVILNGEDLKGIPILILMSQKGLVTLFKVVNEGAESIFAPASEPVSISTSQVQSQSQPVAQTQITTAPPAGIGNINTSSSLFGQIPASVTTTTAAAPSLFGSFQLPVSTATPASTGQSFFGNLNLNLSGTTGVKPLFGLGAQTTGSGGFLGTSSAPAAATSTVPPTSTTSFFGAPKVAPVTGGTGAATAQQTSLFGSSSLAAPATSAAGTVTAPKFNFAAFTTPNSTATVTAAPATTIGGASTGLGVGVTGDQPKPFDFKSFQVGDQDKSKVQFQAGQNASGGGGDGIGINLTSSTSSVPVSQPSASQIQIRPHEGGIGTGKLPGNLPTEQQIREMKSHLQKYDYKNLLEQLNAFERRYVNFKQAQALKTKSNKEAIRAYFTQLDTQILRDLHQITDFARDIIETTNGQREEIEGLGIMLQNLFTKIEYGLVAAEKNMDSNYLRLLRSQPIDPTSLAKLTKVKKQFTYVQTQLKECRRHFYYKDQNLRPLDQAVSTDFLQQTLANHSLIIQNLSKQVTELRNLWNIQQIGRTLRISKNHVTLDDIESGVSLLKLKPTPEEIQESNSKKGKNQITDPIKFENGRVVPKAIVYSSDKIRHLKQWAGQTLITRVPVSGAIDPYSQLSSVRKIRLNPEPTTPAPIAVPASVPVQISVPPPAQIPSSIPAPTQAPATSFFGASGASAGPNKKVQVDSPTSKPAVPQSQGQYFQMSPATSTPAAVPASSSSLLFGALTTTTPPSTKPLDSSFFSVPQFQPPKSAPSASVPAANATTPAAPLFSFGTSIANAAKARKEEPVIAVASTPSVSSSPSFFAPLSSTAKSSASLFTTGASTPAASLAKVAPAQEVSITPVPNVAATSTPTPAFSFLGSSTIKAESTPASSLISPSASSTAAGTTATSTSSSLFGSPVFSFGTGAKPGGTGGTTTSSAPSFFGSIGGGSIFGSSVGAAAGKPVFGVSSASTSPTPTTTGVTTTTPAAKAKPALLPTPQTPPISPAVSAAPSSTTAAQSTLFGTPSVTTPAGSSPGQSQSQSASAFPNLSGLLGDSSSSGKRGLFGSSTPPSGVSEPQKSLVIEEVKPSVEAAKTEVKRETVTSASTPTAATSAPTVSQPQQQSTVPSGLFGSAGGSLPESSSLFGSLTITPTTSAPAVSAASIFGGSAIFGGKPSSAGAAASAASIFGGGSTVSFGAASGSSAAATTTSTSATSSLFGTPTAPATTSSSLLTTPVLGAVTSTSSTSTPASATSSVTDSPSLFGSTPTPSLFGTPAAATPSLFETPGAASAVGAAAASPSLFGTPGSTGSQSQSQGSTTSSLFGTPASAPASSLFGSPAPNVSIGQTQSPLSPSIFGGAAAAGASATKPLGGTGTEQKSLFGSSPFGSPAPAAAPAAAAPAQTVFGSPSTFGGGGIVQPTPGLFSSVPVPTQASIFGGAAGTGAATTTPAFGAATSPTAAATTPAFGGGAVFGGSPAFGSALKPSAFGANSIFGGGTTATTAASFGTLAGAGVGVGAGTGGQTATAGGFGSTAGFGTAQVQPSSFGAFGSGGGGSAFGGGQTQSAFGGTAGAGAFSGGASFGQTQQAAASPAFGGAPSFGGGAVFGGSPAFGSTGTASAFGGATGGSIFGGGSAASPAAAPTFGALASSTTAQGGSIFGGGQGTTFGAQQQQPQQAGFGSFSSFGAQQPAAQSAFGGSTFGGSTFGQTQSPQQAQPQQQAKPASFGGSSFSSWR